ncbi:uncharacterized protein HMPREF1541_00973 [Cyphellophora europaea CBS 101466]|uniref:Tachykinin family protein n=1 Tax=Cyphellophora europaea (strain CBS 101466) TaxID=1220924 RepID=W2SFW1_CYPE1|nr:uncharacterized protein HMPREF1541_00973 [Cyphellophora europaea CBS 101466]ETN46784.1 hypothetical protein HMPREF1541_00973 [Cyphellophora europaea CBS 101466]
MQFSFVNVTGPKKTRREAHLELAEIRSHNTRLIHQRRRKQTQETRSVSRGKAQSTYSAQSPRTTTSPEAEPRSPEPAEGLIALQQIPASKHDPLQHLSGSSDPFDAFGNIQVTPEMNSLLGFMRHEYLPCIFITPMALKLCGQKSYTSQMIEQELVPGAPLIKREFYRAMVNPKNAPGWIASRIPIVFSMLPQSSCEQFENVAAQVRLQSFKQLREDLALQEQTGTSDISLVIQIVHMFKSGLMENQPDSARVHAWALRRIGDIVSDDPYLALDLFCTLMYTDADYAISNMRYTLLDYDHWLNQQLEPYWQRIEVALPDIGNAYEEVDESVGFPKVRGALVRLRRTLAIANMGIDMTVQENQARVVYIYRWAANRTHHDSAQLNDHYHNMMASIPTADPEEETTRHGEAALTLATLYCIRKYMHTAIYRGVDIRDVSHVIIPRLRDAIAKTLLTASLPQPWQYQKALFWALYCGAHYEESLRRGLAKPCDPPTDGWFGQMLVTVATQMNVLRWNDAQEHLEKIVYSDLLAPTGAEWFEQLMTPVVPSELVQGRRIDLSWQEPYTVRRKAGE